MILFPFSEFGITKPKVNPNNPHITIVTQIICNKLKQKLLNNK